MRGSPLVRSLVVLIALVLTGLGLSRLSQRQPAPLQMSPVVGPSPSEVINSPFILTLSAPAGEVTLETNGKPLTFSPESQTVVGSLPLKVGHPAVFITVNWLNPTPSPRFAKLVLEPIGHPTMTKVFDAKGDLSDVWEVHLHREDHD